MIDGALIGQMAGVLSFIAYIWYAVDTIRGRIRPNRATWWILTLVGVMIAASYYAEGARDTMWIAWSYVAGPFMLAVLSLKYGEGTWEGLDKLCFAGAVISAAIWSFSFSLARVVLLINILMDFLGLLPTIKKSYLRPKSEGKGPWTIETAAGAINLFAIGTWTFSIAFYPLYLLAINGIITTLLWWPRSKK